MRPRSLSTSTTRDLELVAPVEDVLDRRRRRWPGEMFEMCSRPSVPLASSTKAPKVVVLTTLPVNSSPTSTSLVIDADALDERVAQLAVGRVDQDLALVVDVDLGLELLGQARGSSRRPCR